MIPIATELALDIPAELERITLFIQDKFKTMNRQVAILGLSGGLDSSVAAALAVKSLGPERVKLYYLPERDSKPIHRRHALLLAQRLEADLQVIKITGALRALGIYSLLPLSYFPGRKLKARAIEYGRRKFLDQSGGEFLTLRLSSSGGSWVARGNAYASAKHRVRSLVLYREAERQRGLVIGAANRTEWLTGTFTQFGCDHNADLMPLVHLYRSQVEALAQHLNIPDAILHKAADPDVLPGLTDKGGLLGSFSAADQILWGLENNYPLAQLQALFSPDLVAYLMDLKASSALYRESPYTLI